MLVPAALELPAFKIIAVPLASEVTAALRVRLESAPVVSIAVLPIVVTPAVSKTVSTANEPAWL